MSQPQYPAVPPVPGMLNSPESPDSPASAGSPAEPETEPDLYEPSIIEVPAVDPQPKPEDA